MSAQWEPLSEDERKVLGIRDGDCGCCIIVDSTGLREFVATREAGAGSKALTEAADAMPFGYSHAAHILRDRAARIGGDS